MLACPCPLIGETRSGAWPDDDDDEDAPPGGRFNRGSFVSNMTAGLGVFGASLAMNLLLHISKNAPVGFSCDGTTPISCKELIAHTEPFLPAAPESSQISRGSNLDGITHAFGTQRTISGSGSSGVVVPTIPKATWSIVGGIGFLKRTQK